MQVVLASTCLPCISFATILFIRWTHRPFKSIISLFHGFLLLLQRCLGDSDKVCPVCERANRKVSRTSITFILWYPLHLPSLKLSRFLKWKNLWRFLVICTSSSSGLVLWHAWIEALTFPTGTSKVHLMASKQCRIFLEGASSPRIDCNVNEILYHFLGK